MEESKKQKFQKLTPFNSVDLKVYRDAINYIFENPEVVNVAISGSYGAGKSSVIESYKALHKELKFVHVSLAHFKTSEEDDEQEIKESILEGKILNQLIHQIPSDKIPQTNFKVKQKVKNRSIIIIASLIMCFFIAIMHIIMFEQWSSYIIGLPASWLATILEFTINEHAPLVSGIISVLIPFRLLYKLIKTQMNRNVFRKLNLQGNEIEIFEESDESYFDKYLNEVLYLFESVEAGVIVFEDMDRFNANRIFERLREINTLANIQLKKEDKPPIRFFYLLRDDIFISKDRTKFFDFIIPIVPVVDSSNSYDQFISHFEDGDIYHKFDENFLQGLSLYIDDMRILKNIYNEFVVYNDRLNTTEQDWNKMLAIIAYKNLFPRDFSDLQLNQGMVFALFSKKDEFSKKEIERLKQLAELKKIEIEDVKKEYLISIEELQDAYRAKSSRITNQGNPRKLRDEYEREYKEVFPVRKKTVEIGRDNRISELEEELFKIERDIVFTQTKQLKEIINRDNIDSIFKITVKNEIGIETNFHEIKSSEYFDLLKYLIRNGFIDESYQDYMTYFYANSISRVDKTFLRSITDKKAKEYTYRLKNPKLVTARLREVDLDQEEALNFDLFEYLLQTVENQKYLNRFLNQLRETKNFKFIGAYFDTERETEAFVKSMNREWSAMFQLIVQDRRLTDKQIRLYSIYTLYYSSDQDIQAVNIDNSLTQYISESIDYLDINEPRSDRLIERFKKLNVSFIIIDKANPELLEKVYSESLFVLNFENLVLMLRSFYSIENEENILHRNYSLVLSRPDSPLAQYIHNHISDYVHIILENSRQKIDDDESAALEILNNDSIPLEQKKQYVQYLQTCIVSISSVDDRDLWKDLIYRRLVSYTEQNIIDYFEHNETLTIELIGFIDDNNSTLNFTSYEGDLEKLFNEVIVCNKLTNEKYNEILTTLHIPYDVFNVDGISDEKFRIIVDKEIVPMNLESLSFIREQYSSQTFYYIKRNLDDYVNLMTQESFLVEEMLEVISWDIADKFKLQLLEFTTEKLTILNRNYSDTVNAYILNHNIDPDDLPQLFSTYRNWNTEIQRIIVELAKGKIELIVTEGIKICHSLLKVLLLTEDLELNEKITLLALSLKDMDRDTCQGYLKELGLIEYQKIFEPRTRPRYEINEANEQLLTAFKRKGWISDYTRDNDEYYKVIRNRERTYLL
ncbi:hypothetical protein DUZ99_00995 [Xylanibacillus composti]|nr:hypothetical protein [Xylanibacillus composti]